MTQYITQIMLLGIVMVIILWAIYTYNQLVKNRQMVKEGFSGIDVQLKKRANLIPNLVAAVKGYLKHEREALEKLTELRARAMGMSESTDPAQRSAVEQEISSLLGKVMVAVENYPDLKANQNVLDLQQQLAQIEHDIQMARRYYNGAVRDNNILVESFPSNLIAQVFDFKKAEYFELQDPAARQVPQVEL